MSLDSILIRRNRARPTRFGAICACLLIGGCGGGEPRGQVVAVVDGVELTLSEVNAEASARGISVGTDRGVRDGLIAALIDRKLLVKAAHERGVDRSPEFILAQRRADEILLAQHLIALLLSDAPPVTDADVRGALAGKAGPAALLSPVQLRLGRLALQQRRAEQVMGGILRQAKTAAQIRYHAGFAPVQSTR